MNKQEALDMIEKLQPDIIILDISMPVINGIEVSRQVKKYWPNIKIIILSQHDNEEYVRDQLQHKSFFFALDPKLKEQAS